MQDTRSSSPAQAPAGRLEWSAPEYVYRKKSADWYWVLGIVSVVSAVIAVVLKNPLFAIFILLASFTLTMYSVRRPETIHYSIDSKGVRVKDELHPHLTLDAYWIDDTGQDKNLLLQSKKPLVPLIIIPLGNTSAEQVSSLLSPLVKEEPMTMPFSQILMDRLGF